MKNSDMPANPISEAIDTVESEEFRTAGGRYLIANGLTKREMFCLHLGVPETGDPELDEIIKKGNRMKIAANAIGGIMANGCLVKAYTYDNAKIASYALLNANAVINAIEEFERKTKNPA
ncbi:TPA: hypothetical protein ACMDUN_002451 [Vibrio cholerae]|uniref:hypothetical protein n=1 Tax=Vibrio cholerae TaxID=666 RepID=UPI000BB573A1|nr:hypothetical protein [Vibrio cholerae]ATD27065.1 hypothetical protein FORC55_1081 [Vibrio cholerae]